MPFIKPSLTVTHSSGEMLQIKRKFSNSAAIRRALAPANANRYRRILFAPALLEIAIPPQLLPACALPAAKGLYVKKCNKKQLRKVRNSV
jgi:hypothetical protein